MNIKAFIYELKTRATWDKTKISLYLPSNSVESIRSKWIYPLFDVTKEHTFKLSGHCDTFNDIELYSITYLLLFFSNISDDITVIRRGDAVRFEVLIENKSSREMDKLILQYSYVTNDNGYKYVQLTNILIPFTVKYNRLSLMIVSLLYLCANDFEYDMWVVQIVNGRWQDTLCNHGGILDPETEEDVQITSDFWVFKDDEDKSLYSLTYNEGPGLLGFWTSIE